MVKVTIEVDADMLMEASAEIIATPGDRIVVVKGKAVGVVPPESKPVTYHTYKTMTPALLEKQVPSIDEVYASIKAKSGTVYEVNKRFGFTIHDNSARNRVKNLIHKLANQGRLRKADQGYRPTFEAVPSASAASLVIE